MSTKGAIFFIQSRVNGMVLDIMDGCEDPGSRVITWSRQDGQNKNQLWYRDVGTGFIRSTLNGFGLVDGGDSLVTQPFNSGEPWQHWVVDGDDIRNHSTGKAFDVSGGSTDEGATVLAYDHHGAINQQWDFIYEVPKYFHIESHLGGKVLDVAGDDTSEGAEVILYTKKEGPADNQLWYEDASGNLRSKMNHFHLTATYDSLHTSDTHDEEGGHFWIFTGEQIANFHNREEVLDVVGSCDEDCTKVCAYTRHGKVNQQWNKIYLE